MLDHGFFTDKDLARSVTFCDAARAPLGFVHAVDYEGMDSPDWRPDLKGFARDDRVVF